MSQPLNTNTSIRTAWLLDWYLGNTEAEHWYVTTAPYDIVNPINSQTYIRSNLPLNVGRLADNIRGSDTSLNIALSGVDATFYQAALDANMNGRPFNVYRAYFDANWGLLPQPQGVVRRYGGFVNSVSFEDSYPTAVDVTGTATFNVIVQLKGWKEILETRESGRFTNKESQQRWYPTDTSMNGVAAEQDRVIILGRGDTGG